MGALKAFVTPDDLGRVASMVAFRPYPERPHHEFFRNPYIFVDFTMVVGVPVVFGLVFLVKLHASNGLRTRAYVRGEDVRGVHPWTDTREPFTRNLSPWENAERSLLELPVNYEGIYANSGVKTLENDIILDKSLTISENGTIEAKNFIANELLHWPSNVIPVIIDPAAPYSRTQRAMILDALWQYHLYTGCSSHIGKQGGRQTLYLKIPGCVTLMGTAIHEVLHNLGFFHEHSRPDRDANVQIIWNDITPGYENNFKVYSPWTVATLGQPYDYDSVMQYSAVAWSKDKTSITIYPFRAKPNRLGQRLKFSVIDIRKMNRAYPCKEREEDQPVENSTVPARSLSDGPFVLTGTEGICGGQKSVDAAMFFNGNLHLFRGGSYWVFKEMDLGRYAAIDVKPRSVAEAFHASLPESVDAVAFMENHFYFFSGNSTSVATSLGDKSALDSAPTRMFFRPVRWTVKGLFEFDNQLIFSNGAAVMPYDRTNDVLLGKFYFGPASGLPPSHDVIVSIGKGRIMILKDSKVYVTKRHLLAVEQGFPRSFDSVFC